MSRCVKEEKSQGLETPDLILSHREMCVIVTYRLEAGNKGLGNGSGIITYLINVTFAGV